MAVEKEPSPVTRGRISLLRVPIDIIPPDDLQEIVCRQFFDTQGRENEDRQGFNIVLMSIWDLLKARRAGEYRDFIMKASMIIPISKSQITGARFLKKSTPVRYMPFHFIINLLSILETHEFTVYLMGGNEKILRRVENNIHQTFPRLRIVGRCKPSFGRQEEPVIVEAIRKAAPHLFLGGRGIRGGELWIARNDTGLNRGIRLWCSDIFDVFAEKRSRPGEKIFNLGLEAFYYCLKNPLRFFRVFSYIRYKFLLLFYRLFNKD
ncbi:MAG: WecB/TagA/CpsF family glycosyltransferase [Treponema sp.]|nr:WecB/TagA/CpsF family glycosyltransferase [Treponema sp.]